MLDILRTAVDQGLQRFASGVNTSMPGVVVRMDYERMRADVQPAVSRSFEDGSSEDYSVILDVPVVMPGSQNSLISIPVQVGDNVTLMFCQNDLDAWSISATGQATPAPTLRQFDMQDAIAIPGLFTGPRSPNNPAGRKWPHDPKDLVVSMNTGSGSECEIRMTPGGTITVNTDYTVNVNAQDVNVTAKGDVSVKASNVKVQAANTTITGNVSISGILTLAGINMNTHKHIGVQPGSGTSGAPV